MSPTPSARVLEGIKHKVITATNSHGLACGGSICGEGCEKSSKGLYMGWPQFDPELPALWRAASLGSGMRQQRIQL
jgi:hypothetical protein